jgi:hypothetical protein
MAKTLKTSGDYTVKAGAGYNNGAGVNTIKLDALNVRIPGNLTVDGDQITENVTNTTIEDQFLEINRNYSGAGAQDSGIVFNQGTQDNAVLYFDGTSNEFRIGTSPRQISDGSTVAIDIDGGSFTLAHIKVATTPSDANHAASKSYVDAEVSGAAVFNLKVAGDDSTAITVESGNTLQFTGGSNISTAGSEPDTITIDLGQNLTNIESISSAISNANLTLVSNGTGDVVINDTLTFSAAASTPIASAVTKIYNKTAGGGGTGLFFINSNISSGTEGELISKKKATALAIALG